MGSTSGIPETKAGEQVEITAHSVVGKDKLQVIIEMPVKNAEEQKFWEDNRDGLEKRFLQTFAWTLNAAVNEENPEAVGVA